MKKCVTFFGLFFVIFLFGCQANPEKVKKISQSQTPEKTPPHIEGKRYSCVDYNLLMDMESADIRRENFGGDTHFTDHSTNSMVTFSFSLYPTKEKANKIFEEYKKDAKRIIRTKTLKDKQGNKIGQKALYYAEEKGIADTYKTFDLTWSNRKKVYLISSESLKAVEEIEKDCKLD